MKTARYLTPQDHGRELTIEELERADGLEGYRYELIDGRLVVSPIPNLPHDVVKDWLSDQLKLYAAQHPEIINLVKSPARVFVPGRPAVTAPEPDVAAYHDFPRDRPVSEWNWRDCTPILVAEVLSEDTVDKDLERNRELYLQVPSIREYWIIDPLADADEPTLTILRRRGRQWQRPITVAAGDEYTTRLLPDFVLLLQLTP